MQLRFGLLVTGALVALAARPAHAQGASGGDDSSGASGIERSGTGPRTIAPEPDDGSQPSKAAAAGTGAGDRTSDGSEATAPGASSRSERAPRQSAGTAAQPSGDPGASGSRGAEPSPTR